MFKDWNFQIDLIHLNFTAESSVLNKEDLRKEFENECLKQRSSLKKSLNNNLYKKLPYYNELSQLRMGKLTVYRLRIECKCALVKKGDKCAKVLPTSQQRWSAYLGKSGDGFF